MKDKLNRELSVGDHVAFIGSSHYKNIRYGQVIGFTPCMAKVRDQESKEVQNRTTEQLIFIRAETPSERET